MLRWKTRTHFQRMEGKCFLRRWEKKKSHIKLEHSMSNTKTFHDKKCKMPSNLPPSSLLEPQENSKLASLMIFKLWIFLRRSALKYQRQRRLDGWVDGWTNKGSLSLSFTIFLLCSIRTPQEGRREGGSVLKLSYENFLRQKEMSLKLFSDPYVERISTKCFRNN